MCATVPGWGAVVQQSAPTDGKIRKWGYLELQPAGCTKGQAIRWWCRRNGIRLKDTMSFGDGKNDVDMIRTTGIGVAMEDGDEEAGNYRVRFYREERCQARIYQARIYQAERYRQGYIRQRDMGRDISYRVILDKNLSGEGED